MRKEVPRAARPHAVKWPHPYLWRGVITAFFVCAVGVVWHNWPQFSESAEAIRSVDLVDFLSVLPLVFFTFVFAATAYGLLAFHRLRFRELMLVELAAAFINRIVPAGLGGLGVHGVFLHQKRHTAAEVTTIIGLNNLLGMTLHGAVLAVVLAIRPSPKFHFDWPVSQGWVLLGILTLVVTPLLIPYTRGAVKQFSSNVSKSLAFYGRRPYAVCFTALALLLLTLTNVFVLHLLMRSFGVALDWPALFVVYSTGVFLGAVIPTPGGLTGVEAGLVGGFYAYGIDTTTAVAIAVTFRLATYWIPMFPGALALWYCQTKKIL